MTAAVAAAFASSDGGTIVVSVGPNGCAVSKNQQHIGRMSGGFLVLGAPEQLLPQADVDAIRHAASGLEMLLMALELRGISGGAG